MNLRPSLALTLTLGISVAARAEPSMPEAVELFRRTPTGLSTPVDGYEELVASLKPSTLLRFTNGVEMKIGREIGSGSGHRVFELEDNPGRVLRLPISTVVGRSHLESYLQGHAMLARHGIPAVDILDHLDGEYAVVTRVRTLGNLEPLTLRTFLYEGARDPEIREKLLAFARKAAAMTEFSDFHAGQLAYDGREWKLLDWGRAEGPLFTYRPPRSLPLDNFAGAAKQLEQSNHPLDLLPYDVADLPEEARKKLEPFLRRIDDTVTAERLRRAGYDSDLITRWLHQRLRPQASTAPLLLSTRSSGKAPNIFYRHQLEQLALNPGQTVRFTDGREVKIGRLLGEGGLSRIFEIAGDPDHVIRLPRNEKAATSLTSYVRGHAVLAENGVPLLPIVASLPDEYVIVPKIAGADPFDNPLLLYDFLQQGARDEHLVDDLVEFARRMARLNKVPDLRDDQIAYDFKRRTWTLIDWDETDNYPNWAQGKGALKFTYPEDFASRPIPAAKAFLRSQEHPLKMFSDRWQSTYGHGDRLQRIASRIDDAVAEARLQNFTKDLLRRPAPRPQPASSADVVELFHVRPGRPSEPTAGYTELVKPAQLAGRRVRFSDGREINLGQLLGQGGVTYVYEVQDQPHLAVRIPIDDKPDARDFIDGFVMGHEPLAHYGVPAVKPLAHLPKEYALVERIHGPEQKLAPLTLKEFLEQGATDRELRAALVEFARKTAPLKEIPDFRAEQMAYDFETKSWRLMDWFDVYHFHETVPFTPQLPDNASFGFALDAAEAGEQAFDDHDFSHFRSRRQLKNLFEDIDDAITEERLRRLGRSETEVKRWADARRIARTKKRPVAVLFKKRSRHTKPVADYKHLLGEIALHDGHRPVEFSDGRVVLLGKEIGSGARTRVFEVLDDPTQVIRIPKDDTEDTRRYLREYVEGHKLLEQHKIPTAAPQASLLGEYVIVPRIYGPTPSSPPLTLAQFLDQGAPDARLADELVEFARKTASLTRISDVSRYGGADQIAYDFATRQWKLMDWSRGTSRFDYPPLFKRLPIAAAWEHVVSRPHSLKFLEFYKRSSSSPAVHALVERVSTAVAEERILRAGYTAEQILDLKRGVTTKPLWVSCWGKLFSHTRK